MSDFEMLSIVLMILGIVVTLLLEIIKNTKNNRPLPQLRLFFYNIIIVG